MLASFIAVTLAERKDFEGTCHDKQAGPLRKRKIPRPFLKMMNGPKLERFATARHPGFLLAHDTL